MCSESKRNMERRPLMLYVTIEVVQEDIDRALRDRRLRARPDRFCPVARAACRALGLALGNVRIGGNTISVWGWKDYDYLYLPSTKKVSSVRISQVRPRTADAARQFPDHAQTRHQCTEGRTCHPILPSLCEDGVAQPAEIRHHVAGLRPYSSPATLLQLFIIGQGIVSSMLNK